MNYYLGKVDSYITQFTIIMVITIVVLVFLILFLIKTVFQVFEANNKVISLFALVPLDEIQNLQKNCEDYKKKFVESKEIVVQNKSEIPGQRADLGNK